VQLEWQDSCTLTRPDGRTLVVLFVLSSLIWKEEGTTGLSIVADITDFIIRYLLSSRTLADQTVADITDFIIRCLLSTRPVAVHEDCKRPYLERQAWNAFDITEEEAIAMTANN